MITKHGIMDLRCFNYAGRMRRKPFLLWYFLTGLGGLVFALLLLLHLKLGQVHPILRWGRLILLLFFGFNLLAWTYSVTIQRLHDIGFSGLWAVAIFIGFNTVCEIAGSAFSSRDFDFLSFLANAAFMLCLFFLPSQPEANKYGPDTEANVALLYQPEPEAPSALFNQPRLGNRQF